MSKDRRWMTSVVKEAAKAKIVMPWARGARRDEMIAKRTKDTPSRSASA